jgi:hypothetical protein
MMTFKGTSSLCGALHRLRENLYRVALEAHDEMTSVDFVRVFLDSGSLVVRVLWRSYHDVAGRCKHVFTIPM